ncbi:MAG TPA: hypothetical protein DCO75_05720 [Fibrobacteres bacterium]|jgi:hypothetical protein|nr:hypothetical protein [Fibrobacterota bacterium]
MKSNYMIVSAACLCCAFSIFSAPQKIIPADISSGVQSAKIAKPSDTAKAEIKKDTLKRDSVKTGFGRLHIIATPDSAVVVMDSNTRGTAPIIIDSIVPGEHTVLIRKKGYFIKKISFVALADTTQQLSVSLVRPGGLVVKSDPVGARLFLDDKESGATPWENVKLKPGDYKIRLEYLQHETFEKNVSIKDGLCDTMSVTLPYTKTYLDSIAAVKQHKEAAKHKADLITNLAVFGAFLIFGLVIIATEAANNNL